MAQGVRSLSSVTLLHSSIFNTIQEEKCGIHAHSLAGEDGGTLSPVPEADEYYVTEKEKVSIGKGKG